jgi:molybdenum cofactor biosynthesis enzyme MoaA
MRLTVVGKLIPQLLRDEHRARVAPFGNRRIEADFGARSALAIEHVTESPLSDLTDS